jgi:hypothetical protein
MKSKERNDVTEAHEQRLLHFIQHLVLSHDVWGGGGGENWKRKLGVSPPGKTVLPASQSWDG